ncbi:MAG: hypothetical protein J6F30_14945 [Cellulosilyticum sp.]|nr:hypothetical protein [Cellulosilyticum sp.]
MKEVRNKKCVHIEDMAQVFNQLNISLKKLLVLYTDSNRKIGGLEFNPDEIKKYLSKQEIEEYIALREKFSLNDDFMVIGLEEGCKNEARLKHIVRKFDKAIKKELTLENNKQDECINTDLRNVILHVETRPMMYLRKRSVYELDAFIKNIIYGSYVLGKTYADTLDENSYWGYFSEWLAKKYESVRSMGWCQILMEQEHDEEKAFDRFFEEFRDYLEEVEHYKSKKEVIEALVQQLMEPDLFKELDLEAELENYPNRYAKEYYERSCYQMKIYCVHMDERYGRHRHYLETFYIERDLEQVWVRYKDTILYQTLEAFLQDNPSWYEWEDLKV